VIAAVTDLARALRYSALSGLQDFAQMFTLRSWLLGWYVRVLAQVAFFALIGRMIGSAREVEFLLVGNAVALTAWQSLGAVASTTWERRAGTLPLLVASPTSPLVVLLGRSAHWIPDGVASSLGAIFVAGPIFGIPFPWPRTLVVVPLVVLVSVTSYFFAIFLGSLVLKAMQARNLLSAGASVAMLALCGVNVPLDAYPEPLRLLAHARPLTHGLEAVRGVFAGEGAGRIALQAAAEAAVGLAWLAVSVAAFRRLVELSRRDGRIEFAS
jgi:ABC-2 type transport system permease protein